MATAASCRSGTEPPVGSGTTTDPTRMRRPSDGPSAVGICGSSIEPSVRDTRSHPVNKGKQARIGQTRSDQPLETTVPATAPRCVWCAGDRAGPSTTRRQTRREALFLYSVRRRSGALRAPPTSLVAAPRGLQPTTEPSTEPSVDSPTEPRLDYAMAGLRKLQTAPRIKNKADPG